MEICATKNANTTRAIFAVDRKNSARQYDIMVIKKNLMIRLNKKLLVNSVIIFEFAYGRIQLFFKCSTRNVNRRFFQIIFDEFFKNTFSTDTWNKVITIRSRARYNVQIAEIIVYRTKPKAIASGMVIKLIEKRIFSRSFRVLEKILTRNMTFCR